MMAILTRIRGLAAIAGVGLVLAAPTFADIKAYNAAVKAGDYKTAANEAEVTWKTWDTKDPQTALLAREFGFAALAAGNSELARRFGEFLVQNGASLPTPDDQPATSAVLFRVADFRIRKGDQERTALRGALFARNGAPGVDMTSALSWEALYVADWNAADWTNAVADAEAAGVFFSRERSMLVWQRKAELQAASALFVGGRGRNTQSRNDLYPAMADVHDRIVGDLDIANSEALRSQLWPLKWRAEAWAIAVESYTNSSYEQVGSNISTRLKPRPLAQPKSFQYPEPATAKLPVCDGRFEGEKLAYPETKRFEGVGSMIVRLETDQAGKVTTAEVLAAIPDENFVSNLVKTMKSWIYRPNPGVSAGSCRLDSRNFLQKASFRQL